MRGSNPSCQNPRLCPPIQVPLQLLPGFGVGYGKALPRFLRRSSSIVGHISPPSSRLVVPLYSSAPVVAASAVADGGPDADRDWSFHSPSGVIRYRPLPLSGVYLFPSCGRSFPAVACTMLQALSCVAGNDNGGNPYTIKCNYPNHWVSAHHADLPSSKILYVVMSSSPE